MNKNLILDFSVDKESKTITVVREFDAELPLVWEAYTRSEILDQWWAPKPWKARTKSMDFREGGKWLYAMVGPNGEEHWSQSTLENIQFQKKFTGTDAFTDADGRIKEDMPQSFWDITFRDKGRVTIVTIIISYKDLAELEATLTMGFKEGLTAAMENLDDLLPEMKNSMAK